MKPVAMSRMIDDPMQFFFWQADEVIPICFMIALGFVTDYLITFTLVGLLIGRIYIKYKNNKPDGFLLHTLYWIGLYPKKGKIPNGLAREYLS